MIVPAVFVLFVAFLSNLILNNSTQESSISVAENIAIPASQESLIAVVENVVPSSNQEQANVLFPTRLKIPAINVDAAVIPVGLTSDGTMDVPSDPAEVAWFRLGPRPGEIGSAVIDGHYDWIQNAPAVFDDLHTLHKGDEVSVEDGNGVITTFVVREIRIYGKDDDASEVFGSDDGTAHLNLITCAGVWNKAEKTYSERLIVFTDKK